jgi:uncharacterized protein
VLRVVFDVNVFISYLLTPFSGGASSEAILRGWNEEFTILISAPLLGELQGVVATSAYVGARVDSLVLNDFLGELLLLGEQVEVQGQRIWPRLRDPDDAYLLEMAVVGEADCLVSGDKGVLDADGMLPGIAVVAPADFLEMLDGAR